MQKMRTMKRHHLFYYLEVYDVVSGALLGNLVDITTRGIKLVSKEQIPIDKTFVLRMVLPEGYFPDKEIHFEGKSIWSGNDVNPDFFDTGFEVSNLDRDERRVIRELIDEVGFND
ncbi:MAG: PilZ domain-containing protein [Desulfovibrionaceae bacterium]|nr:PilZ domain-containing protein [Desulfovibrionaceae bacterium]